MDETTKTSPVSGTGESSDNTGDNSESEKDTQSQVDQTTDDQDDQTDVSDYLGSEDDNTSKTEDDDEGYKKRYSDSSREAQRLAEEVKAKQKEIDEWIEFVKSDPELAKTVSEKSGKKFDNSDKEISEIKGRLANIEKKETELSIKTFESDKKALGYKFTPENRKQIGAIANTLRKVMPYDEALEVAFIRTNKDTLLGQASKAGEDKAFAKSKTNSDATYTTSNGSQQGTKTYSLTQEEQDYFNKMPVTDEKRREHIEHYLNNK